MGKQENENKIIENKLVETNSFPIEELQAQQV